MKQTQVNVESREDGNSNFCATLVAIVNGGTPEAKTVWDNVETNWFPTQPEAIEAAWKLETPFRAKITEGLYEANSYGTFIVNAAKCDECKKLVRNSDLVAVQWAVGSTGFVCTECADEKFEKEETVSEDGMSSARWAK